MHHSWIDPGKRPNPIDPGNILFPGWVICYSQKKKKWPHQTFFGVLVQRASDNFLFVSCKSVLPLPLCRNSYVFILFGKKYKKKHYLPGTR